VSFLLTTPGIRLIMQMTETETGRGRQNNSDVRQPKTELQTKAAIELEYYMVLVCLGTLMAPDSPHPSRRCPRSRSNPPYGHRVPQYQQHSPENTMANRPLLRQVRQRTSRRYCFCQSACHAVVS
jgi:hypothetical protein